METLGMRWKKAAPVAAVAMLASIGLAAVGTPAVAKGGEVGGSGEEYFLNDAWTANANISLVYGAPDDEVYVGDWNADGIDSPSVRRGNGYYLKNAFTGGDADIVTHVGLAAQPGLAGIVGDAALIGDWNGDGRDTVGLYRTSMSEGGPDATPAG